MTKDEFIKNIAKLVAEYAPQYGIEVRSPIIAQAILESAYGQSELATKAHNYFGLKYRKDRCPTSTGVYQKVGSEQNADESYNSSLMQWFIFPDMASGVKGYFDFINTSNYVNLKGVKDPETYLLNIKADGYATSIRYVENLMLIIQKWGLTEYDKEGVIKMAYTNSSLVQYTKLSPNHSGQRTHSIDRITPHCVVGQCSVETLGNIFAPTSRQASCQYGIGADGRIGMYVEEKNRSWCSGGTDKNGKVIYVNGVSGAMNDHRAVTIECASDATAPYAFKDVVYNRLIDLCVDICQRYGKTKLLWIADAGKSVSYEPKADEMVLSVHRWFANKSCPGDWLMARMDDLAAKVTARLGGIVQEAPEPPKSSGQSSVLYRVQTGAYSKKENADAQLAKVKNAGFDTYMVKVGDLYKIQVGAYAKKANADAMAAKLKAAGFDTFITTEQDQSVTASASKTIDAVAREVIAGKWGNGDARVKALKESGYDPTAIQNRVNELWKK